MLGDIDLSFDLWYRLRSAPTRRLRLSRKQCKEALAALVRVVRDRLKEEGEAKLPGLGTFLVKERPARPGRNPQTGELIQIPAQKTVVFRAAPDLREKKPQSPYTRLHHITLQADARLLEHSSAYLRSLGYKDFRRLEAHVKKLAEECAAKGLPFVVIRRASASSEDPAWVGLSLQYLLWKPPNTWWGSERRWYQRTMLRERRKAIRKGAYPNFDACQKVYDALVKHLSTLEGVKHVAEAPPQEPDPEPAPTKKTRRPSVREREVQALLQEKLPGFSLTHLMRVYDGIIALLWDRLHTDDVRLLELGLFSLRVQPPRWVRPPGAKERLRTRPLRVISFRPTAYLKDLLGIPRKKKEYHPRRSRYWL